MVAYEEYASSCDPLILWLTYVSSERLRSPVRKVCSFGIDTAYFIMIERSMTLCVIKSQWNMPYPVKKKKKKRKKKEKTSGKGLPISVMTSSELSF